MYIKDIKFCMYQIYFLKKRQIHIKAISEESAEAKHQFHISIISSRVLFGSSRHLSSSRGAAAAPTHAPSFRNTYATGSIWKTII